MTDKLKLKPWDAAKYLTTDEEQIEFLKDSYVEGNPAVIDIALDAVVRARKGEFKNA